MKRYQVYLDEKSVEVLDRFQEQGSLSRSELIREAVDRLSLNLAKLLPRRGVKSGPSFNLEGFVGAVRLGKSGTTNFARRVDRDYLND